MADMPYEMSGLLSQVVLPLFLGLLLPVLCYRFTVAMGELKERRPKKQQRKGKKRHVRAFVLQKSSHLSRKCCPIELEMESMYKTVRRFTRTIEDLSRYLDKLDWEMSERRDSCWTTIANSEDGSCSGVSLSSLSDYLRNFVMARNVEVNRCLKAGSMYHHKQDLQIQLGAPTPTPKERDMAHHKSQYTVEAFNLEKKLWQKQGLPAKVDQTLQDATALASPSWQPQKACDMMLLVFPIIQDPPLLDRAVKRQLEQHMVKMKIQRCYGLPTKVLEYERNFEDMALIKEATQPPAMQRLNVLPCYSPFDHQDGCPQDKKAARQCPGPQKESADPVDACSRGIPAPSAQPQKARDVLVFPIVRDPPFLDRAAERQLEQHIVKMKIQRCYGLPTKVLEYERNSEDMALIQEATQPPAMQRLNVLPYYSPFDHRDGCPQGKKAARQCPGPQKETADPVDACSRGIPAPSAQPQKARDVLVFPIVQDPPFLDRAAERQLEQHMVKMKIQRCYGLPTKVLEYERNSEDMALIQEATQPPAMQRRSVLPYYSPFDHRDGRPQGKKATRQRPGPQKESADPVDRCPQGKEVPTWSGTAAFLGRPKEMAQQDRETPSWKRKHGELAGGSKAGKKTLPGTAGKEQGPGTQGDVHGPSPSGQAKWALPQSKAAPQGQSGQGSESLSNFCGHMGPPELPLENSIPVREADHSMEGQSSSSEAVGTPELLSKMAASLSRSSPQAQSPSLEKRPAALPLSPDSAGTNFLTPFLSVLTDYLRTRQAAVGLWNRLRSLWHQLYPDEAELPLEGHSPRGAEKGKRSAQGSASSRRLCPECSKAPHRRHVIIERSVCEFEWPQPQSVPQVPPPQDHPCRSDLRVRHTGGLRRAEELRHVHQK